MLFKHISLTSHDMTRARKTRGYYVRRFRLEERADIKRKGRRGEGGEGHNSRRLAGRQSVGSALTLTLTLTLSDVMDAVDGCFCFLCCAVWNERQ